MFSDNFNDGNYDGWTPVQGNWTATSGALGPLNTLLNPMRIYTTYPAIITTTGFTFSIDFTNNTIPTAGSMWIKFYTSVPEMTDTYSNSIAIWVEIPQFRLMHLEPIAPYYTTIVNNDLNNPIVNDGLLHNIKVHYNGINTWQVYLDNNLVGTGIYVPPMNSIGIQIQSSNKMYNIDNIIYTPDIPETCPTLICNLNIN